MSLSELLTRTGVETAETASPAPPPESLVARLGAALASERIRYCQWTGHAKVARWAAGDGDIDLLVDRRDADRFARTLERLGFKLALSPADRRATGVVSYLGLDPALRRLIHVHTHFRLIVGSDWATHYHLPLERAVLETTVQRTVFRTPPPELELLLLVIRRTLSHSFRDAFRRGEPAWLRAMQPGLNRLELEAERGALTEVLARHLPEISPALFDSCLASLRPGCPTSLRLAARTTLAWRLRAYARRPSIGTVANRLRGALAARAGLQAEWKRGPGKRLAAGGAVIGLVGADGAGKSTCARALEEWLSAELLARRVHLGRPPRAPATLLAGGALKASRWLDDLLGRRTPSSATVHLELLRTVATARDRVRLSRRMRRFALSGGVVLCDRYPVPEAYALAGPSTAQGIAATAQGRLAALLRRVETRYYAQIRPPDLVLALRVDPETAVRRKVDEPAAYVRERAGMLWNTDWSPSGAVVVDAARPHADVLNDLRTRIWEGI
jgi:thymidylate kinase